MTPLPGLLHAAHVVVLSHALKLSHSLSGAPPKDSACPAYAQLERHVAAVSDVPEPSNVSLPALRGRVPETLVQLSTSRSVARELFEACKSSAANLTLDYSRLKEFATVRAPLKPGDLPIFWHVPKAAGTAIGHMLMRHSYDLNVLIGLGDAQNTWRLYEPRERAWHDGNGRDLMENGKVDAMSLTVVKQATGVISRMHSGRLFTLLRHPVDRTVSLYYYLRDAYWEPTQAKVGKIGSLEEYVDSDLLETNWMTGILSNLAGAPPDIGIAKRILREYILVGLVDRFEESVNRFERFFGWCRPCDMYGNNSRHSTFNRTNTNTNEHEKLVPRDDLWKKIASRLRDDVELYEYGLQVFESQKDIP